MLQDDGFLVGIAAQQVQVVLAAAKVLDRQVRVVRHRVAPRAPAGERLLLALLPVGRHSGRSCRFSFRFMSMRTRLVTHKPARTDFQKPAPSPPPPQKKTSVEKIEWLINIKCCVPQVTHAVRLLSSFKYLWRQVQLNISSLTPSVACDVDIYEITMKPRNSKKNGRT